MSLAWAATNSMPATSLRIFRLASLQPESRLLITFFVQVMQQVWLSSTRQLRRQLVQSRKNREQIRLGIGRGHLPDGFFQFQQGLQNGLFGQTHGQ